MTLKRKNLDTPLHLAANHGFVEIATKLIGNGHTIDLDAKNLERMTPLHSAARMDREKMMHLLIDRFNKHVHSLLLAHDSFRQTNKLKLHFS